MFGHETISPNNIQANGVAEAVVKIMKCLWHKCRASSEDPLIKLLNIRKSPTEGLKTSPAKRLFGRWTKALFLATESKLCHTTHTLPRRQQERKRLWHQDLGSELKNFWMDDTFLSSANKTKFKRLGRGWGYPTIIQPILQNEDKTWQNLTAQQMLLVTNHFIHQLIS